nr:MAG TPA: hypothetical protein [Caudoviricetes sp.]
MTFAQAYAVGLIVGEYIRDKGVAELSARSEDFRDALSPHSFWEWFDNHTLGNYDQIVWDILDQPECECGCEDAVHDEVLCAVQQRQPELWEYTFRPALYDGLGVFDPEDWDGGIPEDYDHMIVFEAPEYDGTNIVCRFE